MDLRPVFLSAIAFATGSVAADQAISKFEGFTAFVGDGAKCTEAIHVTVRADDAKSFTQEKDNLRRLVAGVGVSMSGACATLKSITVVGEAQGKTQYNGVASLGTDWKLIDQVAADIFAAPAPRETQPVAAQKATSTTSDNQDDPFALFQESATKPKSAANAPARAQTSSEPSRQRATTSSADDLSIYCSGKAQQYTGPLPMYSDTFEFRTVLKPSQNKHTVVNVLKGKIMRDGATYDLLELPNDVMVLSAESLEPKWIIATLKLDLAVGKLSGEGSVDLSSLRGRINSRLRQSGAGSGIPDQGLDSARRVELQGNCIKM